LQIRIIFASAWILIAVAGILGKKVLILNWKESFLFFRQ
jgi:hypothetical protein